VTFEHPRAWTEVRYTRSTSFTDLVTYLSNVKLHDPCATTRSPTEVTTTCGDPVDALPPGGVLVSWTNIGFPRSGPDIPNPNMTIDRRPARITVTNPGNCSRLGAQETVTVDIERLMTGNYYEMVACLRDPGSIDNEALVRRMVASTLVSS
jgi:hypothetical protein